MDIIISLIPAVKLKTAHVNENKQWRRSPTTRMEARMEPMNKSFKPPQTTLQLKEIKKKGKKSESPAFWKR